MVASGPVSIHPELVRGRYIQAPEFEVRASIAITNKEINQGDSALLDDKFFEAQEQIMRVEDITFLNMARQMAGMPNELTYVTGGYTPSAITAIQFQIRNFGFDCPMMLIASNVMMDFLASPSFIAAFDPITTHENIMSGSIARLYGTDIVTDQMLSLIHI